MGAEGSDLRLISCSADATAVQHQDAGQVQAICGNRGKEQTTIRGWKSNVCFSHSNPDGAGKRICSTDMERVIISGWAAHATTNSCRGLPDYRRIGFWGISATESELKVTSPKQGWICWGLTFHGGALNTSSGNHHHAHPRPSAARKVLRAVLLIERLNKRTAPIVPWWLHGSFSSTGTSPQLWRRMTSSSDRLSLFIQDIQAHHFINIMVCPHL